MKTKVTRWFLCVLVAAGPSLPPAEARADSPIASAYAWVKEFFGRDFLGGRKPAVAAITMVKESKDGSSGYYYYQHQVTVQRAGGDSDGFFVVYHAPTWGAAANQIFKLHPSVREAWAARLFVYGYAKPFPPIRAQYYYLLGVRDAKGVYHSSTGGGNRLRAGAHAFTEKLSLGLFPGEYTLELDGEVAMADHPIISLWELKEWFDFGKDLYKAEFLSALGIPGAIFDWAFRNSYTRTNVKYRFSVMAKMPKVTNLDVVAARNELVGRNLRVRLSGTLDCSKSQSRRVLAQTKRPGAALRAKTPVMLTVCSRAGRPHPTPTPQSGAKYYVYVCTNGGNSLFLETPQGIQNKPLCDVEGAGNNCSVQATFGAPIAGPFSTLAAAQRDLCTHLTGQHYNKLVPWGPWVKWGSTEYRCFESECEGAVSAYCPSLAGY